MTTEQERIISPFVPTLSKYLQAALVRATISKPSLEEAVMLEGFDSLLLYPIASSSESQDLALKAQSYDLTISQKSEAAQKQMAGQLYDKGWGVSTIQRFFLDDEKDIKTGDPD